MSIPSERHEDIAEQEQENSVKTIHYMRGISIQLKVRKEGVTGHKGMFTPSFLLSVEMIKTKNYLAES